MNLRHKDIQPFHVMDILAKAKTMQEQGIDIIHLEIGEPDFATPEPINKAAISAIEDKQCFYTSSLGLKPLREKIAEYYQQHFDLQTQAENIVITAGASGALLLVLGAILDANDSIMLAAPGYPCNTNFAKFLDINTCSVEVDETTNYQLSADLIKQHWHDGIKAVILASPANPTGTLIYSDKLREIYQWLEQKEATLIVDEIYHQLVYDMPVSTALSVSENIIVINSFSKYYQMTGWRLGWCVVPEKLIATMDKLSQNLFLAASTPAQYGALAAFSPETQEILQQRRETLKQRRDFLLEAIKNLGFKVPVKPQGAFYIYADCSLLTSDSFQFCMDLLQYAHVAITPGIDFGSNKPEKFVRFSYTQDLLVLKEAINRIKKFISKNS
ncbi:MAG: aminotransferase class I/II-fold pyridoxal phosphate-dependent enzyme [Gammaproteobacteria bacterium]|nr:aminotransferase class I/II-fold pyridoxal phosphate-dependent enzyme [Gammaproteobacteria bacterium]